MIRNPRLSGLKPLLSGTLSGLLPSPAPVPPPERLLRRCPVSGTAKGKAKISKERDREVEREKLGLISEERQREIDAAKAAAKKGSSAEKEEPVLMGTPGFDLISLGLVDAEAVPKYELTAKDGRRLAEEYSRVMLRRHRARQAAESTLLRLKEEAIEALPEHLRAAAMVPDLTPFPVNRFMATLTPPIEGYVEKVREATRATVGREKLR